jgi:predicted secreted hydrolase
MSSEVDPGPVATADLLGRLAEISADAAFERLEGPWTLSLPDDHGAHPEARTEAWVIVVHLKDETGGAIGLWFSLSRFGLREKGDSLSTPWDIRALHRAELGLAGEGEIAGRSEQRLARGSGVAGHDAAAREVWIDHWTLDWGDASTGGGLTLSASLGDLPLDLALTPLKPAWQVDGDGATPVRGFVVSRMAVSGSLGAGDARRQVAGTAWLDRGWGELPLPGGPLAYDRLQLHLDDGTDVSVVRTRRRDGRGSATVDGVVIDAAGTVTAIPEGGIDLQPSGSGSSGSAARWEMTAQDLSLGLELLGGASMGAPGPGASTWLVRVEGSRGAVQVAGLGTLQLSGVEAQ